MKEVTIKVMMPEGFTCWETQLVNGCSVVDCPFLLAQMENYACFLLKQDIQNNVKLPNCPAKKD